MQTVAFSCVSESPNVPGHPLIELEKNYLFKLVCYIKVIKVKSEDIRMEAKRQILDTA